MSGFLHRLAAQAMGKANTLRSAALTPYAAPLSPTNRAEPDSQIPTLDAIWYEQQHLGKSDAKWAPLPGQEQQHANSSREIGAQPQNNQPHKNQPHNNEVIPTSPEVFAVESETGFHTVPDLSSVPSSSAKAMLRQSSIDNTVAGEPPVLTEGIEMHIPGDHFTALTDSNDPSPLLPLKNIVRPSALNANVAKQRGEHGGFDRQGQVEEITEVHVSIGRIEVTAVHEALPPKRQAPAPAKPLSLDEYLARRGRGT
ncbi:MAG: hypothetical protein ABIR84_01010 [Candidatus Nitrotoga sp.]